MKSVISEKIAQQLSLAKNQVEKTIILLEEGATIPFIARYRKEQTGSLDEVEISNIENEYNNLITLEKRKETILKSIKDQGKLTDELETTINKCYDSHLLEDIYLPFKPKKRTKATIAKEKGLEKLAQIVTDEKAIDIEKVTNQFLNENVDSTSEALSGARDIIAEWVSEHATAREIVRREFDRSSVLQAKVIKGKEKEGEKYRDYFNWEEPLKKIASHRFLAIQRAKNEGFVRTLIKPNEQNIIENLNKFFLKRDNSCSEQIKIAIKDSYKRQLKPSIENEFLKMAKEKADREAIDVFANNLRQLLLAPPLGEKRVLAIDPGFKSGCKVVCLDEQGNLLHNENIYPHKPQEQRKLAAKKLTSLIDAYRIEAIAIGDGTASRETEAFIKKLRFNQDVLVFMVNEDGASVYSASSVARKEFPQYDVTVRGAVSIGRRLMDPLAELVKIDPKSIGVGQYQHDINEKRLQESLDKVVVSCVNAVGVNLNSASENILTYISGLGETLAKNIVAYRKSNGAFTYRKQLLEVPRMGKKSFEQAVGFLRINNSENPLDNSAVHPESYGIVEKMAKDLNCKVKELIGNKDLIEKIRLENYTTNKVGLPTLEDIKEELLKPGRDPRQNIKIFEFDKSIFTINDLKVGMVVPGIVNNITNFGAFVDIGIKQSGLIHVSEMANRFISDPNEIVHLQQHLKVKIKEVDIDRNRIQLSLKGIS